MPIRVQIDIFSGLPNPVVEVEDKQATPLLERLKPARSLMAAEVIAPPPIPVLGYRGLIVEQVGRTRKSLPRTVRLAAGQLTAPELTALPSDENVEDFLLGPRGILKKAKLDKGLIKYIEQERERFSEVRSAFMKPAAVKTGAKKAAKKAATKAAPATCNCAPIYEPQWWNDDGLKQFNNNCYNYSTNYRSDTFAQPGRAEGIIITNATCVCAFVKPAAMADSLIDAPNANNRCPAEGHLVALVMAPGFDFHWYRKGPDGMWSHKVGPAPVTNLDNSGQPITDPRTANRGPYIDFCGFMIVKDGHIKLI